MTVRLLAAADRVAAPWKNGGGLTWTIASDPPDAGVGDFQWRLSLARVEAPGPFSRFGGMKRHLAVVAGGPLLLRFADDGTSATITAASEAFTFAGDRPVVGELPGEVVTDLNFMVRRSADGALLRRSLAEPMRLTGGAGGSIVLCLGPVTVDQRALRPLDAVWLDAGEAALFAPEAGVQDIWVAGLPPR